MIAAMQGFICSEKYEVIPETVGQFTGLTDKNGKKIFEGDIIQFDCGEIYEVKYIEEQTRFLGKDVIGRGFATVEYEPCKVVGSIY